MKIESYTIVNNAKTVLATFSPYVKEISPVTI